MKKLGILFTSRNNYELLQNWVDNVYYKDFDILNIDEDSEKEIKENGKKICEENNIVYMDREERGMQNNIVSAFNYYEDKDIDWIIWFQHDCFPANKNFFNKLNEFILSEKLNKFGLIGFNGYHNRLPNDGKIELEDTARTPLEVGDKWYRNKKFWPNTAVDYSKGFNKPFAVESVTWYSVMVNRNMYKKYIIPTDDYHFFHAWDDIAFQFLYNNIYNICLPYSDFVISHNQFRKLDFDIPRNSPNSGEKREYYWSKWGHLDTWKERWGFDYDDRNTFESVKEHYKDTLLWNFYHHDPSGGPLKSFDI